MSRLVVFGCSYAYGYALPDCNTDIESSEPSKFSWPAILAKTIEKPLINKSYPASSIKRIWYTINNFKFKPDDVVIISWSYAHRYSIINNPWNIKNLINTATDDIESMAYYEHNYSWYDSYVMSKLFVDDANRTLKENNIKVYNLFLNFYWKLLLKNHHNVIPLHIEKYLEKYPLALDNAHLGLEGNRAFAEDLLKYLV